MRKCFRGPGIVEKIKPSILGDFQLPNCTPAFSVTILCRFKELLAWSRAEMRNRVYLTFAEMQGPGASPSHSRRWLRRERQIRTQNTPIDHCGTAFGDDTFHVSPPPSATEQPLSTAQFSLACQASSHARKLFRSNGVSTSVVSLSRRCIETPNGVAILHHRPKKQNDEYLVRSGLRKPNPSHAMDEVED